MCEAHKCAWARVFGVGRAGALVCCAMVWVCKGIRTPHIRFLQGMRCDLCVCPTMLIFILCVYCGCSGLGCKFGLGGKVGKRLDRIGSCVIVGVGKKQLVILSSR